MRMTQLLVSAALALALTGAGVSGAFAQQAETKSEKKAGGGHAHGEKKDLGTTTVAGMKLGVAQMGEVKAGSQAVFEVKLEAGQEKPKALRLWVGNASAEGSVKAKATGEGPDYDVHVEVPKTLPQGSQLWLDVEPATGKKAKAAFAFK